MKLISGLSTLVRPEYDEGFDIGQRAFVLDKGEEFSPTFLRLSPKGGIGHLPRYKLLIVHQPWYRRLLCPSAAPSLPTWKAASRLSQTRKYVGFH